MCGTSIPTGSSAACPLWGSGKNARKPLFNIWSNPKLGINYWSTIQWHSCASANQGKTQWLSAMYSNPIWKNVACKTSWSPRPRNGNWFRKKTALLVICFRSSEYLSPILQQPSRSFWSNVKSWNRRMVCAFPSRQLANWCMYTAFSSPIRPCRGRLSGFCGKWRSNTAMATSTPKMYARNLEWLVGWGRKFLVQGIGLKKMKCSMAYSGNWLVKKRLPWHWTTWFSCTKPSWITHADRSVPWCSSGQPG